ncbi:Uncharacterised protein [Chlamydia trachomatis]|nr:Uncharacterised protein [Chlamydia trachomatis]CRI74877.1 Uncharacterised protein [Chlamydia trachomatis]
MKIPPPINVMSKIAFGIVFFGLIVSSERVETASNPKNE